MEDKKCLECNEPIVGRSDKKFCDDQCRNAYYNKLNSDNINIVRNINNYLRKNRRILESLCPDGKNKVKREKLLSKGYDFKYHTHTYTTKDNTLYLFCYDYGILSLENDWYLIVKNEKN